MATETHATPRNRRSFLRMVALGAGVAALVACGATAAKPGLTEDERAALEALGDETAAELAAGKVNSLKGVHLPNFSFQVEWNNQVLSFQEASGMDVETQIIEYRGGASKVFIPQRMPGIQKGGNVTLKKGVANLNSQQFTALFNVQQTKRMPLIIKLLDETGQIVMTWTLRNAWFTKITRTELTPFDEVEFVAIETLEVAHEGLTIS